MAFPTGASTITLTGTLTTPAGGSAATGKVILTPTATLADGTHKAIYTGAGSIALDTSGSFSVVLLCNDSLDVRPAPVDGTPGWQWRVDEQPVRGQWRTYWINLPSTLGPTVDLAQLTPITAPAPIVGDTTARPTGPAGGALTGTYPNPSLSAATIDLFDPAGAAATAQGAATAAAASDAAAKVAAHNAATTGVHGIVDTTVLETQAGATAKVSAHASATDPHGDRAYTLGITDPLANRVTAVETGFTAVNGYMTDAFNRIQGLETTALTQVTGDARYLLLTGGTINGDVTLAGASSDLTAGGHGMFNAAASADYATLPKGQAASNMAGLVVGSSYAGGDDDGTGTDSTGRINLYSYQRANVGSFGENIRNFAMRSDAKTMQAFYIPVQSANKRGGYDPATRDPMASGVSWKPVVWQGAHYESNDHASIHGHWELEIADLNGALQGRLEIPFIDQAVDGTKALDQATIGVAYTNIRTNLSDLSVRAQNMTAGPYSGQNTALRVGGNNTVNKELHLSISSDMGTGGRRWVLRANNTTESGSNAGTDLQIRRYDDGGNFIDAAIHIDRATGRVGMGGTISPTAGLHIQRATGQVLYLDAQATTQSALLVNGVDATVKALQTQVSGDTQKRFQVLIDGAMSWGTGAAAPDITLYRANTGRLKTDTAFHVGTNMLINTTSVGAGVGVLGMANATTVPSANPTAGGVLYASGGALFWRGSSGTVTQLAPA